jgi:hypothetical protein
MSETIKISDDLTYYHREDYPSYPHGIENTFINSDEVTLTDAEFDALAMHNMLVKRMIKKLVQLDNFYPNDEELERLLADIAALEEK